MTSQVTYFLHSGPPVLVNMVDAQQAEDMARGANQAVGAYALAEFTVDSIDGPRTFTARQVHFATVVHDDDTEGQLDPS